MAKIVRYAGFWVSAVWAHLMSAAGLVALAAALALGWRGVRPVWILAAAALVSGASLYWFEKVDAQTKVGHALTNSAFEFFVTLTICVIGYVAGRLARRLSGGV